MAVCSGVVITGSLRAWDIQGCPYLMLPKNLFKVF